MKNRDTIDDAAEREADALARFEELTGVEQPISRLVRLREMTRAASDRGLPPASPLTRYPRRAAVRAWLRILDRLAAGHTPSVTPFAYDSPIDRLAREQRRLARLAKLLAAGRVNGRVSLSVAAKKLPGVTERKLQKWIQGKRLPATREVLRGRARGGTPWRYLVRLSDVRSFLIDRLSPAHACARRFRPAA